MAVVLFVAFVRDFADLGAQQSWLRYALECVAVFASLTVVAAALTRSRVTARGFELVVSLISTVACVVLLEGVLLVGSEQLERLGSVFTHAGAQSHHGLAAALFVGLLIAFVARVLGRGLRASAWDAFLVPALRRARPGFPRVSWRQRPLHSRRGGGNRLALGVASGSRRSARTRWCGSSARREREAQTVSSRRVTAASVAARRCT